MPDVLLCYRQSWLLCTYYRTVSLVFLHFLSAAWQILEFRILGYSGLHSGLASYRDRSYLVIPSQIPNCGASRTMTLTLSSPTMHHRTPQEIQSNFTTRPSHAERCRAEAWGAEEVLAIVYILDLIFYFLHFVYITLIPTLHCNYNYFPRDK